jgi:hypothetical protein
MSEMTELQEGSMVLMIEPSDIHRRHTSHKVIFEDMIGWIDLESEELEIVEESNCETGNIV